MTQKPGIQSTEFWSTLIVHAITLTTILLTALHVTVFNADKLTPLVPAMALVASSIAQAFYSHSRGTVKAAAAKTSPPA